MVRVSVQLRELVKQRLDATAEEIFELLERTITEYEENLISKYEQQRQASVNIQVLPALSPDITHLAAIQTVCDEGQTFEVPPELVQIQIVNAQGAMKKEQLLESIPPTLVKEEPITAVIDTQLHCDAVKEEVSESKALSLLFIKQEPTEQSITSPPINGDHIEPQGLDQDQIQDQILKPELIHDSRTNQNYEEQHLNQNPNHTPHQNQNLDQNQTENKVQDLNQDFEEDNVEWEFEGLSPQRQSPEETENSSEDDATFPPDHPSKLQRIHNVSGQTPNNDVRPNADDETTVNSSDASETEVTTPKTKSQHSVKDKTKPSSVSAAPIKEFKIVSNNIIKSLTVTVKAADRTDTTAAPARKQKRKRFSKKKGDKSVNNSSAEKNHVCDVCKSTFDTLSKLKAHAKAHTESLPCPVCGKMFKQQHFMLKHMKMHQSKTQSQATTERNKRKGTPNDTNMFFKKRRWEAEEVNTDPDHTEDSSDGN